LGRSTWAKVWSKEKFVEPPVCIKIDVKHWRFRSHPKCNSEIDRELEVAHKLTRRMNLAQDVEEFLLCLGVDILDQKGQSYKVSLDNFLCYVCVVFGSLFRPQEVMLQYHVGHIIWRVERACKISLP